MALNLNGLSYQIGSFCLTQKDPISLPKGKMIWVRGASGSGKSTLLQGLAGFIVAKSGSVQLDSVDLTHLPAERRRVALVFQEAALFPHLTVEENVEYGLRVLGLPRHDRQTRSQRILKDLEISELANRYPQEISGGQAHRVSLARSAIMDYPVLLLDEPFAALQVSLRAQLTDWLFHEAERKGWHVLVASHDPLDSTRVAHQILVENGSFSMTN